MNAHARTRTLEALAGRRFDVIVIGGGINGTGIARDAAMRGLRVLLLEQEDVGAGTSAWSTRLIHGGLRYLEHYEFGLVRESLRERELLFQNAPHLVKPLRFLVPIYRGSRRGRGLIRLGMLGYDLLSYDRSVPGHRMLSPRETMRQAPGLNRDGLLGAATYYDGQIEYPERICVENALSAVDYGATVCTYTRVDRLLKERNHIVGVEITDMLCPNRPNLQARAPLTINVAGPWVDTLTESISSDTLIGGTKGSHIIVEPFSGAPSSAIYIENERDARPYFIVPWNGLYLIGTTDFRYQGDLEHVVAGQDEIDYLISDTNRVIPDAALTRSHVRYTYSGVRPLPYVEEGSESGITRRHLVHDHAPDAFGLLSIIGGKLTTFRSLAEHAVDLALRKLGRTDPGCRTSNIPLPGANTASLQRFAAEFRVWSDLDAATADRLTRIYGVQSRALANYARSDAGLLEPLQDTENTIKAEIPFAFEYEGAQTLTDALMRRSMLGLRADNGLGLLEDAARVAAARLGWHREREQAEIRNYHRYLERFRVPSS